MATTEQERKKINIQKVTMSQIVLPFEFPSDTEIIYADPSEDPEFLINTSFLVAVDSKSFVEMVSSYWSSVEAFTDSDIALFMEAANGNGEENETNDYRRFILHLAENGFSSDLIKNHLFKVKENNLSTGVLFFDCVRLPDHTDSQKTCKLSYCSSAAFKFPAINVDFFLYSFNLKEVIICLYNC